MNFTLFKTNMKRNWVLLIIFFAVLTMYLTAMISMFNPDDMQAILDMVKLFPENLMKAMGFDTLAITLTGYLASWLYGLLMLGFPMVYCIILGNRLVAKMVDNGSFAYLLSTPNSRVKIIVTQGVYALISIVVLFAAIFGLGVLVSNASYPGLLDVPAFFKLNITTMLVNMTVLMISFFFSCLFNDTKNALGFGAGLPILFLLMNMISGASDKAEVFKNFTIYGLYDPVKLVNGTAVWGADLFYILLTAALFAAGVLIFNKKQLPL